MAIFCCEIRKKRKKYQVGGGMKSQHMSIISLAGSFTMTWKQMLLYSIPFPLYPRCPLPAAKATPIPSHPKYPSHPRQQKHREHSHRMFPTRPASHFSQKHCSSANHFVHINHWFSTLAEPQNPPGSFWKCRHPRANGEDSNLLGLGLG